MGMGQRESNPQPRFLETDASAFDRIPLASLMPFRGGAIDRTVGLLASALERECRCFRETAPSPPADFYKRHVAIKMPVPNT